MKEMYNLATNDWTGISFWIISAAMVAATAFFWMERDRAEGKWKTSLSVAALVTGIAAIHYFYMRGFYVASGGESPVVFRYVDWLLTVPLQIVEFYLILAAIAVVRAALFWKLLVASLVMLLGGFWGEAGLTESVWLAFGIGMVGWLYIIYEIFVGEASQINASSGTAASQTAFNALKWIVTVGWAIYPIGYILGVDTMNVPADQLTLENLKQISNLNLVYNLADFVNKIAFGVVIWSAATSASASSNS